MIVGIIGLGYVGLPLDVNNRVKAQRRDDVRESPDLRLREQGTDVIYHDPFVPDLPREGISGTDLDSALADAELAVIVTAHPGIDHAAIAAAIPTVDLRGVTRTKRATRMAGIAAGKES